LLSQALGWVARQLVELFNQTASPDWPWFEHTLTYDNGRLPEALLAAYRVTGDEEYHQVALESLEFLLGVLFEEGKLDLIGNNTTPKRAGATMDCGPTA